MLVPWRKALTNLDSILKSRDITLPAKVSSQSYGFSTSHVWMWKLDYKESWAPKYWCFWTVVLEKILEHPLDCKEIWRVLPKGNQSWIFIGRTDAETPILWPPDAKNWLMRKDHDAGKDWRWEGWEGWMASLTWWTWVCLISGSWWWTGKPGMLQSMGSQKVGHDWVTKLIVPISKKYLSIYLYLLQFLFSKFYNFQFIDLSLPLVKYIPTCFTMFDAIVNGIVFLNSLSHASLCV